MVARAPRLNEALGDLLKFVGDHALLGHNIGFDLAFLRRKGIFEFNEAHDTLDMASVLLPTASRYGLASLAAELGVPVAASHRALDDAQTSRSSFICMRSPANCPPSLRRGHRPERSRVGRVGSMRPTAGHATGWILRRREPILSIPPPDRSAGPLRPTEETTPLDPEELASILEPGGPLARHFGAYEHRPQQVTMLRAVARSLSEGRHLMVEAGTGTGKGMAYLVPAFAWASANGRRVVVSTNTINLQEQLLHKDIPDLAAALGFDLRASVLKGRANYLCPRRLDALRRLGPRTSEEMRLAAKVLVWLSAGGSGDRGQVNLLGPARRPPGLTRPKVTTARPGPRTLQWRLSTQRRIQAETSHVLIVNHALLLADIATGNRVLPEYQHLIVDEAHHLEAATTKGLSFQVTEAELARWLRDLTAKPAGLLAQTAAAARRDLPPDESAQAEPPPMRSDRRSWLPGTDDTLVRHRGEFLPEATADPPSSYGQQEQIVPGTHAVRVVEIEFAWERLREPWRGIQRLQALAELLAATEGSASNAGGPGAGIAYGGTVAGGLVQPVEPHDLRTDPQRI
jgi:DNA polymerase-3 subunit epsilon/ATP-dependent DNA helicase DinG